LKRVLYSVSPIGLGHATRASAVAREFGGRVEILFASGGAALDYLKGEGFDTAQAAWAPVPAVSEGEMKRATVWYAKFWLAYRRSRGSVARLVKGFRPDLIIGDEEFGAVSIALEEGIGHALVTDELELGFARSAAARALEARVLRWYNNLLEAASKVVIPTFGEDTRNRMHVGPIVRDVTEGRAETRQRFSLPAEGEMVLLSLSGSGIGGHLVSSTIAAVNATPGTFLAVSGNRGERITGAGVRDLGVVRDNQNLVAAADLVVSTAGKSTIDEATSAGTPIIPIPIRNHAEQERNAAALGFHAGDTQRLTELVKLSIGKRQAPASYDGARRAARLFLSML
jgi:UDP-N-acetylglucosamine--N-acetylmuramyl-(pentapeptide) pyrophosphoryl-undecaprenol N-acetylglucosamine transferase